MQVAFLMSLIWAGRDAEDSTSTYLPLPVRRGLPFVFLILLVFGCWAKLTGKRSSWGAGDWVAQGTRVYQRENVVVQVS